MTTAIGSYDYEKYIVLKTLKNSKQNVLVISFEKFSN